MLPAAAARQAAAPAAAAQPSTWRQRRRPARRSRAADIDAARAAPTPRQGWPSAEAARRLGSTVQRAACDAADALVASLAESCTTAGLPAAAAMPSSLAAWPRRRAGWPIDAIVIAVVVAQRGPAYARRPRRKAWPPRCAHDEVTAAVWRDGALRRIASRELVRGDLLVLAATAVGADARLVEAAPRVQEAAHRRERGGAEGPRDFAWRRARRSPRHGLWRPRSSRQRSPIVTAPACAPGWLTAAMLLTLRAGADALQKEVARIGRRLGVAVVVIALVVVASVWCSPRSAAR